MEFCAFSINPDVADLYRSRASCEALDFTIVLDGDGRDFLIVRKRMP